jgi:hypothetical protein
MFESVKVHLNFILFMLGFLATLSIAQTIQR